MSFSNESTDVKGRFAANVVVGSMQSEIVPEVYLLKCVKLERANRTTITQLFTSALGLLWLEGIQYDNVLLLFTDVAP